MISKAVITIAAGLALSGAALAQAQSADPPRILRVFREDIKPGRAAAHERVESNYARALAKAGYPSYVALDAMTGATQTWFIERHESYASLDAAIKLSQTEPMKTLGPQLDAQDGELRTGERGMIGIYQKDLSYLPGAPVGAKARYYTITTVRIRPGHATDFAEMRKLLNAAFEKSGNQQRRLVYSVNSGAFAGTYLILGAMDALKAMDPRPNAMSMPDAFGAANLARYEKLQAEILISSENVLFTINPRMSNAPKEYVTADPEFWAPKPKPAAAKAASN